MQDIFEQSALSNFTTDEIYQILRKDILTLKLSPGMLLSENQMSQRFNTSRTPVRNVFARLHRDGLIVIQPKKGTFVSPIDLDMASQIIFMRALIEITVMKQVIRHPDQVLFQKLEENLKYQKEGIDNNISCEEYFKLDSYFHELSMIACNKQKLWQIIQNMDVHYSRYRLLDYHSMYNNEVLLNLYQEHEQLYQYITTGASEKLRFAVFSHLYGGFLRMGTKLQNEYASYFVQSGHTIEEILIEIKLTLKENRQTKSKPEKDNNIVTV
jgi:GntR family transcriptional regulator, rspAB operon transcriptional repressor